MAYSLLADEIILQIVGYVHSTDIVNFARVNTQTYHVASERYKKQLLLDRNAKVMTSRFGPPVYYKGICMGFSESEILHKHPELAKEYNAPEKDAVPDLDYLNLNEDLHWLEPLDPTDKESHPWARGKGAEKEPLDKLVASGKRAGVIFPPSFLAFMASTKCIECMYLGGDYVDLGPELVKCHPQNDNNGGGYVIRFLRDQQHCCYWALYVAPGGYHCVLATVDDVHCWKCEGRRYGEPLEKQYPGHPSYEASTGIMMACEPARPGHLSQCHPDFERWLVKKYFDGLCHTRILGGKKLTERQKEYLDHFWPKK